MTNKVFLFTILGGPVVAFEDKEKRSVLIGTIHGAFYNCDNELPGIFVETDDISVLEFLYREAYGSGLSFF